MRQRAIASAQRQRAALAARHQFLSYVMNSSEALNTMHEMVRGFSAALPRLILAALVVIFFYFLSFLVKKAVRRSRDVDPSHRTLRMAMGRIVQGAIIIIGALIAVAAAFPGFTPANLISALGIGGIAIGFAFKDIFENFLAGILILITRPFRIGDQIIYDRYEGTVEDIWTRATWLRTYDGRRILIPNSELFKNTVTVNTAFATRRLEYDFKLNAAVDIEKAKSAILSVLHESDDVLADPAPDAVVVRFDQADTILRARWWSPSHASEVVHARDRVLTAARTALTDVARTSFPQDRSTLQGP